MKKNKVHRKSDYIDMLVKTGKSEWLITFKSGTEPDSLIS